MWRVRNALVATFVVLACSEPAGSGRSPTSPSDTTDAGAPRPSARAVELVGDRWRVDGVDVAAARSSAAPGVLDDELRPTYAIAELTAALARTDGALPVRLPADATVSHVRNLLASAPDRALAIESGGASFEIVRAPADAPAAIALADDASIAALAKASGSALAMTHAPCVTPPAGMACVPGGRAIVGDDAGPPEDRPRRELEISTFYIEQHEITISEYDACHAAGGCPRRINGHQNIMKPFVGPNQPVVPMDWERAAKYCAWAGKRLPTEWEWEKAARGSDGDAYPWGNDEPTCERAQYRECAPKGCKPYPGKSYRWDCNEHDTKPVGTYPAGHYGLFEMAGNGYEWTASAGVLDVASCGASCNGRDPLGPCDGAHPCVQKGGETRVLKGGSWYWPAGRIRGAHRRVEPIRSGGHRLSARCATSDAFVTTFPPRVLASRPRPAELELPSEETRALARTLEVDAIAEKPICGETVREAWHASQKRGGRSELDCRDPFPYLESNEPRAWQWARYVANLGGGYVGVGSDQNYSFIAQAGSEWAWVLDYDPRVVDHHLRMRAFVLKSATPQEFVERWASANAKSSVATLEEVYAGDPALAKLRRGYWATHERMHVYYREQLVAHAKAGDFGWLRNPEHYRWIRTMFEQGRLVVIPGDLLATKSMRSVAAAAKAIGVPVRIYYTSNAPLSWGGQMTPAYRDNVRALPFDGQSVVLQTTQDRGGGGYWHHNVQWGRHLQERLSRPGYDHLSKIMFERVRTDVGDVSVLGLPGATP
jgi:formylglycine-generating enzyme required for sulfatase activity